MSDVTNRNRDTHGRFAPEAARPAGDPVDIPDSASCNLRNVLAAQQISRAFKEMVRELSDTDRQLFDRLSMGDITSSELARLAEDPNTPTALRFAIANLPIEVLVERGLHDPDWRVQAGALASPACDPDQVDFSNIETQAVFAALLVM
jgi:hypothetical protein